ncbi:hypothetical protein HZS_6421 [Henneguya salminicola]|nr:hypothetical protein HZS_6421 [Henneguya salminicola]
MVQKIMEKDLLSSQHLFLNFLPFCFLFTKNTIQRCIFALMEHKIEIIYRRVVKNVEKLLLQRVKLVCEILRERQLIHLSFASRSRH